MSGVESAPTCGSIKTKRHSSCLKNKKKPARDTIRSCGGKNVVSTVDLRTSTVSSSHAGSDNLKLQRHPSVKTPRPAHSLTDCRLTYASRGNKVVGQVTKVETVLDVSAIAGRESRYVTKTGVAIDAKKPALSTKQAEKIEQNALPAERPTVPPANHRVACPRAVLTEDLNLDRQNSKPQTNQPSKPQTNRPVVSSSAPPRVDHSTSVAHASCPSLSSSVAPAVGNINDKGVDFFPSALSIRAFAFESQQHPIKRRKKMEGLMPY